MAGKRKSHSAAFKAQVALAAVKGDKTINELASHYGVHPTLIHAWKKQLLAGAEAVFATGAKAASAEAEVREAELYEPIGRLNVERLWRAEKYEDIDLWGYEAVSELHRGLGRYFRFYDRVSSCHTSLC